MVLSDLNNLFCTAVGMLLKLFQGRVQAMVIGGMDAYIPPIQAFKAVYAPCISGI